MIVAVSGFYQTEQIQAYPSRPLDCLQKMLVQHREERGSPEARHRLGIAPPEASCLPNGGLSEAPHSFDYAV